MNTKNLEQLLNELIERFNNAAILSSAAEYQRVMHYLESRVGDDGLSDELSMLISASSSAQGLSDMCPEGYDYAKWVNLVEAIRKESLSLQKQL